MPRSKTNFFAQAYNAAIQGNEFEESIKRIIELAKVDREEVASKKPVIVRWRDNPLPIEEKIVEISNTAPAIGRFAIWEDPPSEPVLVEIEEKVESVTSTVNAKKAKITIKIDDEEEFVLNCKEFKLEIILKYIRDFGISNSKTRVTGRVFKIEAIEGLIAEKVEEKSLKRIVRAKKA